MTGRLLIYELRITIDATFVSRSVKACLKNVAAGILPAVEGGILPPGPMLDLPVASELSKFPSAGLEAGSTAGRMPCRYNARTRFRIFRHVSRSNWPVR